MVQAGIEKYQSAGGWHASCRQSIVRPLRHPAHTAVGVRKVSVGIEYREPISGRHAGDPGDLPAAHDLVRKTRGCAQEFLPMAERKLIDVAGHKAPPDPRVSVFRLRISEIPEVADVLRGPQVRVRGIVDRVRPGIGRLELQSVPEALLVVHLQRVVTRRTSHTAPEHSS